jgi:excisionase family DNA binding protein
MTQHDLQDLYDDLPAVVNVPQAAQIIGVSERTVRTLIADGRLGHLRVGRLVRIPRHRLLEFIGAPDAGK